LALRIRTIKPAFWTSQDVATLPDDTHRLLFVGLWNYVDDEGRGADDPRLIKAALFPLNDAIRPADIDAMLWRLPSVVRYGADDRDYLAISTWDEHQKISHPKPSDIPPPDKGKRRRRLHGTLLEPSGLEVEQGTGKGSGREGNGVETAARSVDNNPNQPLETQLHFDEQFGLGIPAIVKLNQTYGREHVLEAMRQVHGSPPAEPITDHYGYIATVASFKAAEAVSA
jgi:hypothetical protein